MATRSEKIDEKPQTDEVEVIGKQTETDRLRAEVDELRDTVNALHERLAELENVSGEKLHNAIRSAMDLLGKEFADLPDEVAKLKARLKHF